MFPVLFSHFANLCELELTNQTSAMVQLRTISTLAFPVQSFSYKITEGRLTLLLNRKANGCPVIPDDKMWQFLPKKPHIPPFNLQCSPPNLVQDILFESQVSL